TCRRLPHLEAKRRSESSRSGLAGESASGTKRTQPAPCLHPWTASAAHSARRTGFLPQLLAGGLTIERAARQAGVTLSTAYRRHRDERFQALVAQLRQDKG